jgi:hypothetical protein
MTEYLELVLLTAFVVSATGLLIAGVVALAIRLSSAPSARAGRTTKTPHHPDDLIRREKEEGT